MKVNVGTLECKVKLKHLKQLCTTSFIFRETVTVDFILKNTQVTGFMYSCQDVI
jgi:hypothetical protein